VQGNGPPKKSGASGVGYFLSVRLWNKKAEPGTPHFFSLKQDIVAWSQEVKCELKYVMFTQSKNQRSCLPRPTAVSGWEASRPAPSLSLQGFSHSSAIVFFREPQRQTWFSQACRNLVAAASVR
jgi:hypothetical protein